MPSGEFCITCANLLYAQTLSGEVGDFGWVPYPTLCAGYGTLHWDDVVGCGAEG